MRAMTAEEVYDMEELIDRVSLWEVLNKIEQIMHEKADHVRETWNDENLARQLNKCGRALAKAQSEAYKLP